MSGCSAKGSKSCLSLTGPFLPRCLMNKEGVCDLYIATFNFFGGAPYFEELLLGLFVGFLACDFCEVNFFLERGDHF